MKRPELLLHEDYDKLNVDYFPERFHRLVFGAINNLIKSGVEVISPIEVDSFLSSYSTNYHIFTENNGIEYLEKCMELAIPENFDYFFKRLEKFNLLNDMPQAGLNPLMVYNDQILDPVEQEKQQNQFDGMLTSDILDIFEHNLLELRMKYDANQGQKGHQAGKGMSALKEELKRTPEMGAPLASKILTTITRGARLKKVYMRSASSGLGKTRLAVGDAGTIAVRYYYDTELEEWIDTKYSEPTLFITTELEIDEIQTMFIAFVSGVNEEVILDGKYTPEQEERVDKAIEILEASPLWIEHVPSFNMQDIERVIKKYKYAHEVKYVFFDYIFTSAKMLIEIASKARGVKLREDNVLYMFIDRMKYLCNTLEIHLSTSSQVNGEAKHIKSADESVLRGAKALADKLDVGVIAMPVSKEDEEHLQGLLAPFSKRPNLCYHIYKVRRGKFVRVKLWCYVDLGTCRTIDLFLTKNNYELINIDATTVEQILDDNSLTEEEYRDLDIDAEEDSIDEESQSNVGEAFIW